MTEKKDSKRNVNTRTVKLTVSAMMIALAFVLNMIKIFQMPQGGDVTLFSMLPICIVAHLYGTKWGILTGAVYGVLQALTSGYTPTNREMTILQFSLMMFLDYILAYSVLGLTGIFRGKFKNKMLGFILGISVAAILRLSVHTVSGYILFAAYAEAYFAQEVLGGFGQWVLTNLSGGGLVWFYSLVYNATYLLPETILTIIAGSFIRIALEQMERRQLANN